MDSAAGACRLWRAFNARSQVYVSNLEGTPAVNRRWIGLQGTRPCGSAAGALLPSGYIAIKQIVCTSTLIYQFTLSLWAPTLNVRSNKFPLRVSHDWRKSCPGKARKQIWARWGEDSTVSLWLTHSIVRQLICSTSFRCLCCDLGWTLKMNSRVICTYPTRIETE